MSKRKSLSRTTMKVGSTGRVLVEASKRNTINPGPSKEAVTKIERFEASTSRAEQRLGQIKLT